MRNLKNFHWSVVCVAFFSAKLVFAETAQPVATPDPNAKAQIGYSTEYVHSWIAMPEISATDVKTGEEITVKPQYGEALVLVFIASWCVPCQNMVPELKKIEKAYSNVHTRFIYVFSHDTKSDAQGFMNDYGIDHAVLASKDLLKNFKNPELPSIYLSDRYKWMATRYVNTKPSDLVALRETLRLITGF